MQKKHPKHSLEKHKESNDCLKKNMQQVHMFECATNLSNFEVKMSTEY